MTMTPFVGTVRAYNLIRRSIIYLALVLTFMPLRLRRPDRKQPDRLFETLPNPLYSIDETQSSAERIYEYVWQHSDDGSFSASVLTA